MDIIKQLGEVALGSRLKRLSDRFAKDATTFYRLNNLDFEPRWFPTFFALTQSDTPLSIMDLAEQTGLTHPAILQFVKEMEAKGLITTDKSGKDARKRMVSLSEQSKAMLPRLQMVWAAVSEEILRIIRLQKNNLLFAIEEMEELLDKENYVQNLSNNLKNRQLHMVEIIDYRPEYQADFKAINVEWIEKYFRVEPADLEHLDKAQEILDEGGFIFLAKYDGDIVGTTALKKMSDEEFELIKMGVRPKVQGKQIGKKLALHAIEKARAAGAKRVSLESNTVLTPAIELYKKVGFRKTDMHASPFERCNIQMVMDL
jgi:DNA-binding MarR family transcriptional regulator/GNAT superfamily N-acetyltransferase